MVQLLPYFRWSKRSEVIVECRRCGTTVDGTHQACPTCGETGFAVYEISG